MLTTLPIVDSGTPRIKRPLARLIRVINAQLDGGRSVVVHCAGGLGRSGVVVGCWLRSQGVGAARALDLLREMRGPRCPENETQREYVRAWSR
jgi:protein-tyrosine phosphatase